MATVPPKSSVDWSPPPTARSGCRWGQGLPQRRPHYAPWDMPTVGSADPFGFTGELHDDNLVHLRARWYHPSLGTFTSRDPFAGFGTLPYSQHPYQYAYSNPVMLTDPSGKFAPALAGSIATGAAIGAGVEIGNQMYDQYRRTGRVDWGNLCAEDIGYAALAGAIAGGGGFVAGTIARNAGTRLLGSIVAGAAEGAVSDMVVTAVTLTLRGEQVTADRMIQAALVGAVAGGIGGAIGWKWGPKKVIRAGETAGGQDFCKECHEEAIRVAQARRFRDYLPDDGKEGIFDPLYRRYGTDARRPHYAVRNPDGTITDTTILQNIAAYSGGRSDVEGLSKEFPKLKKLAPYDTFDPKGYDILLGILHRLHIRKYGK